MVGGGTVLPTCPLARVVASLEVFFFSQISRCTSSPNPRPFLVSYSRRAFLWACQWGGAISCGDGASVSQISRPWAKAGLARTFDLEAARARALTCRIRWKRIDPASFCSAREHQVQHSGVLPSMTQFAAGSLAFQLRFLIYSTCSFSASLEGPCHSEGR